MSLRKCRADFKLDEIDEVLFKEVYAETDSGIKAINAVLSDINSEWKTLSKLVKDKGKTLPPLRSKVKEEKVDDLVITAEERIEEEVVTLTERQEDQLDGWSRAGVDENIIELAEQNTELLTAVDVLTSQYKKEGMAGREAFLKAVDEVIGGKEAMPEWATPTAAETTIVEKKSKDKKAYIKTKEEARAELEKDFGTSFTNIEFVEGQHPSGRNVLGTYYQGTGKIKVWYENVPKGDMAELILHEKGVHEMLAQDPNLSMEYQSILDRMEVLLTEGNKEVTQARAQATKAYNNKYGELSKLPNRNSVIAEETVAYLMNAGKGKGWFRRFVAEVKKTFKNWFSIDLQPDDLRILVRGIVEVQAQSEIQTQQEIEVGVAPEIGVDESYTPTAEELAMFGMESIATDYMGSPIQKKDMKAAIVVDVSGSVDQEYTSKIAAAPQTIYGKAWDYTHHVGINIREKALKFMPQSDLLERGKSLGMASFSKLEDVTNRTRAMAHANMDKAQTQVLEPVRKLQSNNPEEYVAIHDMMTKATIENKDMKETREFSRLSNESQTAYKAVENYYKDQATQYITALETQIGDMSDGSSKELQSMVNTFKTGVANNIYFPMQRFGRYRLDAVDAQGIDYVSFSDHISELKKEAEALTKQGYTVKDVDQVAKFSEDAHKTMEEGDYKKAQRIVEELGGNPEAKEALWKVFMQMAPSNQLKDRMKKRRFVKGASTDLTRGIATTINFYQDIARRQHSVERASILEETFTELKDMPNQSQEEIDNKLSATQTRSELMDREEMAGQSRANWSSTASKFNFILNLGFNPSSALINMTQNYIVGVPVLGSEHGAIRAATAINRALTDTLKGKNKGDNFLEGNELAAYQAWKKAGVLDDTQAMMHTQLSEGASDQYGGKFDRTVEASAWMFHNAEVANRVSAGLAAYRLSTQDGMSHADAVIYSGKSINEIHFDYSEEGKSQMQRTDLGAVLLAFKSYPIKMAFFMANNAKKSFVGLTQEEKVKARKQLSGTMIVTSMFGGAMALPLNSAVMLFLDMLYFDDDEDAHKEFREWTTENFGEDGSEILMNGLASYLTGTNLSGRVSLDKMFFRIPEGGGTPDKWADEALASIIGPVGSRISSVPKGVQLMADGKFFQGMEAFMPAVYTNTSKAVRWGTEGQAHNNYDSLMEDDFSSKDTLARLMGFTSLEYATTSSDYWMDKRIEQTSSSEKRKFLRNMAMAIITGDADDRRSARRMIRGFNRGKVKSEQISQSTIKRRVKELRKRLIGDE